MAIRAPFPWFGGKSRAAHLVWERFGDVPNYVEPFAGSLAVLLGRPTPARIETVNDLDCYLSNFWRAVQADPEAVAHFADWPVNEADLHARHRWLVNQADFREQMRRDPEYFDAKIAGWWVWGICQWIGSGWCSKIGDSGSGTRPHLSFPSGVHRVLADQKPMLRGDGGAAGAGIHASGLRVREQLPDIGGKGTYGKGVHAKGTTRDQITTWMSSLAERLRRVRVCCGEWDRVLGRSATECIGVTGVFLDPPYGTAAERDPSLYAHDDLDVAEQVRQWAVENGENPLLRIALCGYEGEHDMPDTWECVAWKANGGYAAAAGNHENAHRERIWFSPHCLGENQMSLV